MAEQTTMNYDPLDPKDFLAVDFVINDAVAERMYKALKVIATSVNISSFLSNLDPKALHQVVDAADEYVACYRRSTNS